MSDEPPRRVDAVRAALQSTSRKERLSALYHASELKDRALIGDLRPLLDSPDKRVRADARTALAAVGDAASKPRFIHELESGGPDAAAAAWALAILGDRESFGALWAQLARGNSKRWLFVAFNALDKADWVGEGLAMDPTPLRNAKVREGFGVHDEAEGVALVLAAARHCRDDEALRALLAPFAFTPDEAFVRANWDALIRQRKVRIVKSTRITELVAGPGMNPKLFRAANAWFMAKDYAPLYGPPRLRGPILPWKDAIYKAARKTADSRSSRAPDKALARRVIAAMVPPAKAAGRGRAP